MAIERRRRMAELSIHRVALDDPARAVTLAAALGAAARARSRGFLCTYALTGDVLALGRYPVVPPAPQSDVRLLRRIGGGRPAPLGYGYVAMTLALPHAGALVRDDPATLAPERILNRAVRGLLGALESLGVQGYYPGRDVVTAGGRTIAGLGIEVAPDGAVLVETSVALARSFAEISRFADRAGPSGVVPMDLMSEEQGTSVSQAGGRAPDLEGWAAALAIGYASRLGLDVAQSDVFALPSPDPTWLDAGRLAPHLERHAAARDLLGVVEVYVARTEGRVGDVRLCGDLIAPSATIARLEERFRGAPIDRDDLRRRALAAAPDGLLGVRSTATIGDLVYQACAA